jgi:organic hydroperoxide reductase OsmC/OhrA
MDRGAIQAVVDAANIVCLYSNAARGSIDVRLSIA